MSDPAKRFLRVVLGLVLGLVGGTVVGLCMIILLFVVCIAADGGYNRPNETKLVPCAAAKPAFAHLLRGALALGTLERSADTVLTLARRNASPNRNRPNRNRTRKRHRRSLRCMEN